MTESFDNRHLPLTDGRRLQAGLRDDCLLLGLDQQPLLQLRRSEAAGGWRLEVLEWAGADRDWAIWATCYWHFAMEPHCQRLLWGDLQAPAALLRSGLLVAAEAGEARCERELFWQLPAPWLQASASAGYPQQQMLSDGRRHPRRPPKPQGELYRRYDARLGAWISLRSLDIELDLARFNRWQNNPRVLQFWQEGGSLEQHREYLQRLAADPHSQPLIGCFDDEPFAYFEAYWAKEDRIAPFYAAGDYDRGIHMLVGEESQRGPHRVNSWLPALAHYLLLDEPRTQLLVAEPRADNQRMIGYMQGVGFHRLKDFDFPHKRAALMAMSRECFFDRCALS